MVDLLPPPPRLPEGARDAVFALDQPGPYVVIPSSPLPNFTLIVRDGEYSTDDACHTLHGRARAGRTLHGPARLITAATSREASAARRGRPRRPAAADVLAVAADDVERKMVRVECEATDTTPARTCLYREERAAHAVLHDVQGRQLPGRGGVAAQ